MTTADDTPLTARQDAILRAVCRDYVIAGDHASLSEPVRAVSSDALVRRHGFRWSSATLRQELAALERMGYLWRPHRSAGCAPTRRGLSHFVASLGDAPIPDAVHVVDHSLRGVRADPAAVVRAAACVLSEVSGCLAVTFFGAPSDATIEAIDLVPLSSRRALVVLTLPGRTTRVQPVDLDDIDDDMPAVLDKLRASLRAICVGRSLARARAELHARLHEHEADVDRLLAQALRVGLQVCDADAMDPLWIEVAGQTALVRASVELYRLGDMLALLEDDQRLAQLLCQLLPEATADAPMRAEVRVGADGFIPAPHDDPNGPGLSLVGCRMPARAGLSAQRGAVAIIGPDRMDYAAVIPLVEYAARALAARVSA